MWSRVREEDLNVMLAELLSEYCLKAVGEVIIRRKCDAVVMVEVVKLPPEKQTQLRIGQKMIKQALKNGIFHVGFVTYVDRGGLGRWIPRMRKKPEFYENVDFQKLVAYLMTTYDALVKEINRDKVLGYLGLLNTSNVPI